jgi:GntR family transcriptional regulator
VPEDIAATLGVEIGSAVIEVERRYRLSSGVVAEVAANLYPADRFQLSMTLRRSKTSGH